MILRRKNITALILITGRFDNMDLAVLISRVSKAVQNYFRPIDTANRRETNF